MSDVQSAIEVSKTVHAALSDDVGVQAGKIPIPRFTMAP